MEPDLVPDIYEGIGMGHGTAGTLFEMGGEDFVLADSYGNEYTDELGEHVPSTAAVLLHNGSRRRFAVLVQEVDSDTPPEQVKEQEQPNTLTT